MIYLIILFLFSSIQIIDLHSETADEYFNIATEYFQKAEYDQINQVF